METAANLLMPYDARVAGLFPDAAIVGDEMQLPHTYSVTRLLRNMNYDVPAPVLTQYDWNGLSPYEVQKKTVAMMTTNRRAYVLNGLGTGKTLCALWAFDFLRRTGEANKMLVVGPLSTMSFTWESEVFRFMSHYKTVVLHGTKAKRLAALESDADIYIINHDGVSTIYDELMARDDIDVIVLDELSVYRNGSSQRNKLMRKVTRNRKWVYGLTGSPMPRCVTDVWGLTQVIDPSRAPKYFKQCQQELMYQVSTYRYLPKEGAVNKAFDMLQPSVRYSLDDIVELPDVVYRYVEVPLGANQKKLYKEMHGKAVAMAEDGEINAANAAAVMSKLLQISTGWVYNSNKDVFTLDNELRVQTMVEMVSDADHKVLVFAPFKSALSGLGKALEDADIEYATVSGDTSASDRNEIFSAFQDTDKYKVLVAHPACLAHGITLTAATTIIWFGPVLDLEVFFQANGRITRLGQKHKQLVLMFGGTPIEKKVYDMLGRKESTQREFLDLIAEAS
jgi:hypothetical protein